MVLLMDGKKISLKEEDLDALRIGEGEEGIVYYYEDYALKVYRPTCGKIRLDEKTCQKMIPIQTYNILLPRGVLQDMRRKFSGYYTDYIPSRRPIRDILSLKMGEFTEKVNSVYDDLDHLADEHIEVCDFHLDNFSYDCDFFFVDPGSYSWEERKKAYDILMNNQEVFSDFIQNDIFSFLMFGKNKKKQQAIRDHFLGCSYLPDMFEAESDHDETVKKYVKRITS